MRLTAYVSSIEFDITDAIEVISKPRYNTHYANVSHLNKSSTSYATAEKNTPNQLKVNFNTPGRLLQNKFLTLRF